MSRYLIQTVKGKIVHDFSFTLLQAIEYSKWSSKYPLSYRLTDTRLYKNYVPIGPVEFVTNYLQTYHNYTPKPINIPEVLLPFAKRNVINGTDKDIDKIKGYMKFIKSNDRIKSFTHILESKRTGQLVIPEGNYQISEYIAIDSEWRCFVFKGKIVGLQNYLGNFKQFPDVNVLEDMIDTYTTSAPVAYTLDVGVSKNKGTFIIEVHDFFSCGLYGFSDLSLLPYMFSQWWYQKIKTL